jgi:hypothetical protein
MIWLYRGDLAGARLHGGHAGRHLYNLRRPITSIGVRPGHEPQRMAVKPHEYFSQVTAENARTAVERPGDLRLAINAIMTLDGFFGSLHAELYEVGLVQERADDQWKEKLARGNKYYRLLRDSAYALTHGRLDDRKPRLVRRPDQIMTMPAGFDAATFDRSAFDTETVWIETDDNDYRAAEMIKEVLQFARERLEALTAAYSQRS